jgi:hypothetical protein
MRINAIIGLLLAIFMLLAMINYRLETISEQVKANGQIVHHVSAEYVVIRNDELWDVREVGR